MKSNNRLIVDLFVKYYKSVFKLNDFRFVINNNTEKMIQNFCEEIKKISGSKILQKDYLEQYFEFQFNHWYRHKSENNSVSRIQISWIIGNKALGRWKRSDNRIRGFVVRKNLKSDINILSDYPRNDYSKIILEVNEIEEADKRRFHNTNKGFYYCQVTTTLYNHKSELCEKCKNKVKCKKELYETMPFIYKKRGYE